jgi:uncharacterized membrane protein YfcA
MQLTEYLPLILAALFGSTLAGMTGFGGAAILLPVLVHQFGPRDAIPILTAAQLIGNGSRVYFHRKELDWRVVGYFAVSAIPAALIGGYVFSQVSTPILLRVLDALLQLRGNTVEVFFRSSCAGRTEYLSSGA